MTKQPLALRLADWHRAMADEPKRNEAKRDKHRRTEAELRRLHQSEKEGWRHADELEQDRKRLHEVNAELVKMANCVVSAFDRSVFAPDRERGIRLIVEQLRRVIIKATGEQQ